MDRDITLELREERRLRESCEHCRCCRSKNFCCWCSAEDVGYDLSDECNAAYDNWRDKGV